MEAFVPRPLPLLHLDPTWDDFPVEERLDVLVADATAAVPSLVAVEVVLIRDGCPVVLHTRSGPSPEPGASPGIDAARTSLRLPLSLLGSVRDDGGQIVFYAAVVGSLVDLAADAAHVLGKDGIALDADLPPRAQAPGVVGLAELTVIERAHGVLIQRGHDPSEVAAGLRGQAAEAGLEPHAFAVEVLEAAHRRARGRTL